MLDPPQALSCYRIYVYSFREGKLKNTFSVSLCDNCLLKTNTKLLYRDKKVDNIKL